MMTQAIDAATIPPWDRATAMRHATTEYDAYLALLRSLSAEEWATATECEGWDVRAMSAHVLGMAEWLTSFREFGHVMRAGNKGAGPWIDNVTAVQVADRASITTHELVARLDRSAPKAIRTRRRVPQVLRRKRLEFEDADGNAASFTLGQLHDVILTRDVWMHRLDVSRAIGREMECTPGHDAAFVADVVRDWAEAHRKPFRLVLTGPAGGEFVSGTGGEAVGPLPATEFCRILSHRAAGAGLLTTEVPF